MMKRILLATTALFLVGTTAALADCASLRDAYVAGGGDLSDVTLTNPEGSIECEYEGGVLVGEEIVLEDGTEVEREYDESGNLIEEEVELGDDQDDDSDEDENEDRGGDRGADGNRGHGDDEDGFDDENPGRGHGDDGVPGGGRGGDHDKDKDDEDEDEGEEDEGEDEEADDEEEDNEGED